MPIPSITSVSPLNLATGIVLGIPVVVTFNTLIDHSTVNIGSFALVAPGNTAIITPTEEIQAMPKPVVGKQNVPGVFSFDDTQGFTVLTFTPKIPLEQNTLYKVTVMGTGSLISQVVKDTTGVVLDKSYGWTFTTGILSLSIPPVQSPIITARPDIDPTCIVVVPRKFVVGQDLTQEIDLIFPDVIDQTSFDPEEILLSIEAILGDPSVIIPPNLQTTLVVQGNRMKISITGWPTE